MLLLGRGRRRRKHPDPTRIVPALPPNPGAEMAVMLLLGLSSLSALGFILVYAFADSLSHVTQLLGLALGLAFLFLAAALVVVGEKLVPTEQIAEDYPPHENEHEQQVIAEVIDESGSRFPPRPLQARPARGGWEAGRPPHAGSVVRAALPGRRLPRTPWRRGRRLVDEHGRPYKASDIEENDFYLAFPEGARERGRSRWRPRSS